VGKGSNTVTRQKQAKTSGAGKGRTKDSSGVRAKIVITFALEKCEKGGEEEGNRSLQSPPGSADDGIAMRGELLQGRAPTESKMGRRIATRSRRVKRFEKKATGSIPRERGTSTLPGRAPVGGLGWEGTGNKQQTQSIRTRGGLIRKGWNPEEKCYKGGPQKKRALPHRVLKTTAIAGEGRYRGGCHGEGKGEARK